MRAPRVFGIFAVAPNHDPAFDIDGLPNPFSVYFPIRITNLYSATIYVTALLISPPAGWTDSEQNITSIGVGSNVRTEKSNATRATPSAGSSESITVRFNYRTGSYAGPIIGYDQFTFTIYWESISAATIDATDDFEAPCLIVPPYSCDGWVKTDEVGTVTMERRTDYVAHGAYSLALGISSGSGQVARIQKTQAIGAGSRAYIFGFLTQISSYGLGRIELISPLESYDVVYTPPFTWRRWGLRLTPGTSNQVTIRVYFYWPVAYSSYFWLDYFRWVHY